MPLKISQKTLTEYQEALTAEKKARAVRETLRHQILALAEEGAAVESGKYDLKITEREFRTSSWPKIAMVVDDDTYQWLREHVPPTRTTYLQVYESPTAKTKGTTTKHPKYFSGCLT